MDQTKRAALKAAGFRVGDAEDFLELGDAERRLVELRLNMSRKIRDMRQQQQLTQADIARRLKSSQSRVAKIEAAAGDVSLDLMFRSFFSLGGRITDLTAPKRQPAKKPARPSRR